MADMKPQGTQDYAIESGYEEGDANVKSVIVGAVIIFASTFVVMAAMFALFNVLNNRLIEQDGRVPAVVAQKLVPPEPRLLPSPYTDTQPEANRLARATGQNPAAATADPLPWDKRTLEIRQQYVESNIYARTAAGENSSASSSSSAQGGRTAVVRIPVSRAMALDAGINPDSQGPGGTPAIMPWQPQYPNLVAGSKNGHIILEYGEKKVMPQIFDDRPVWESLDEKFSVDSSGGLILRAGELSK